jgi:SAM-dependent methyltransferase/tetratricopeptide (TPR) repeat protein
LNRNISAWGKSSKEIPATYEFFLMSTTKYEDGLALFHCGKYVEAIPFLRAAAEEQSTAERWNDLGTCQFAVGDIQAELSFRHALSLDPAYAPALLNLGVLLAKAKRHVEALPLLDRVHATLGDDERRVVDQLLRSCRGSASRASDSQSPARVRGKHPRILFLGNNFGKYAFTEANASEAWRLYSALRGFRSTWDIRFASVEREAKKRETNSEHGIELLPVSEIAEELRQVAPDLLHIVYPLLAFDPATILHDHPVLLTVTGADPTEFCTERDLETIRHLIDFGRLAVVCESEGAQGIVESHDIKVRAMIPPIVAMPPSAWPRAIHRQRLVCGFATSPLLAEHWESRGVLTLLELARLSPDIDFRIAWRTSPEEIEREIAARRLQNVSVHARHIDMEAFYAEVDVIVLPLGKICGNHASPLSAVEGLLRGKPVLATEFTGIAGWIEREGVGIVTSSAPEALRSGLLELKANCGVFSQRSLVSSRRRFNSDMNAAAYLPIYCEMIEAPKGPTLAEWDDSLRRAGGELVRGRLALASYYTQSDIANRYIANRFVTPPFDQLNAQELEAVRKLIRAKFGGRTDLTLLDLASGTGRLLPALLPFGSVTALDRSSAMLEASREHASAEVRRISGDVFDSTMSDQFHVVTCGRFLRHFEYPDRKRIYQRFHDLLLDDGIGIVDVPDPKFENGLRDKLGWEKFGVYDVFWTLSSFRDELRQNGFQLARFEPVGVNIQVYEGQRALEEGCWHVVSFEKLRRESDANRC